MFDTTMRSIIVLVLACAVPLATAQSYQDTQREFNEKQQREMQDRQRVVQIAREDQENFEAHRRSIEKVFERDGSPYPSQGRESSASSDVLLGLFFTIVGGSFLNALIESANQPRSVVNAPREVDVRRTLRYRQEVIYRQCKTIRQSNLVQPKYEKPNSWALFRVFQSDRAEEFKAAMLRYQVALKELEPTCKCVGDMSVSEGGFSEPEWKTIAERARARTERPWMALEESRVRGVFGACAAKSPSDKELSWLYATAAQ